MFVLLFVLRDDLLFVVEVAQISIHVVLLRHLSPQLEAEVVSPVLYGRLSLSGLPYFMHVLALLEASHVVVCLAGLLPTVELL